MNEIGITSTVSATGSDVETCALCGYHHKAESGGYRWVYKRGERLEDGYYRPRLDPDEFWALPEGERAICTDRQTCKLRRINDAAWGRLCDTDDDEPLGGYIDEPEDDCVPCGCPFCFCSNCTIAGETCNECRDGAHQG